MDLEGEGGGGGDPGPKTKGKENEKVGGEPLREVNLNVLRGKRSSGLGSGRWGGWWSRRM